MRWSAMSDSGKRCPIFVKKARNSRRKRLNIQRMGSVQSVENFDPAIGGPVAGHGTANNICGVIEEGASSEQNIGAGEGSKASDGADNQSTVVGAPATADEVPENSTCSSHGWFSMMGRRRVMEDTVMVAPGAVAPYDFFAVYDGHGGARVALACRERMHKLLVKEIEGYADGGGGGGGGGRSSGGGEEEMIDWEKVMVACFAKMDGEVRGGGGERVEMEDVASAGQMIGSTAVVVVVGKEEVVTANCGDSRAVLCRGGVAVPLSCDHKPDRPDERERVEAAGGRIINWNGSRVLGVLATSRSIGAENG
ncbi:probable protein phosphatase 2C 8 isoform X2 [Malania oleifera]|uniref:probable protein phosphatase 2C 8 isoform X2 n=1 Tax=Malania oleifera TaxID=397392 RepID=UPI0025AEA772|nr:probable protein phosphatase 2C 8 isoform X2 [Malania oleifera]